MFTDRTDTLLSLATMVEGTRELLSSRLAPNADKSFKQAQFNAPCLIFAMEMGRNTEKNAEFGCICEVVESII
mgnify:CR=1 FL=1